MERCHAVRRYISRDVLLSLECCLCRRTTDEFLSWCYKWFLVSTWLVDGCLCWFVQICQPALTRSEANHDIWLIRTYHQTFSIICLRQLTRWDSLFWLYLIALAIDVESGICIFLRARAKYRPTPIRHVQLSFWSLERVPGWTATYSCCSHFISHIHTRNRKTESKQRIIYGIT